LKWSFKAQEVIKNPTDIPTRIEALPLEELDEKSTMRPGDIRMLLGGSTGIQVQPTSAVSGTASFRIQGLDICNTV
jgi:outer membrane receptor for ferrienterochelin and colicins